MEKILRNQISLAYIALTTVLFVFPPSSTVTGSSMSKWYRPTVLCVCDQSSALDYAVAAFAVIIIISVFQWFIDGRKNFTGPRVDITLDALDALPVHEAERTIHEK